ncbi:MAG: 2-phosphosulfolactate phosphatase [Planctomycetaceae bacterium]
MHITVQKLPRQIDKDLDQVAVVVDVLRATSVIATALDHGASEVIACVEIDEARRIAAGLSPTRLLCGERLCLPINGFDLGNSPRDYSRAVVQGRQLIMTTTNGTAALAAARNASQVLAAAFVNLSAVARYVLREKQVTIVCAGTDGQETEEDVLFAGALIARIGRSNPGITLSSEGVEAVNAWQAFQSEGISLSSKLSRSRGGRNLVETGYSGDIDICANIDSLTAVPIMVASDPITLRRAQTSV